MLVKVEENIFYLPIILLPFIQGMTNFIKVKSEEVFLALKGGQPPHWVGGFEKRPIKTMLTKEHQILGFLQGRWVMGSQKTQGNPNRNMQNCRE